MGNEPKITINGHKLSEAEAMTVRVALGSFAMDLSPESSLGDDDTGKAIRSGYFSAIRAINQIIEDKEPNQ